MINHDLKFIFMHIPKNAGTSLEKSLAKIQGTEDVSGMLQNKRDWLIYQTTNANPNYLFILFSRNPYDRLVSVYRHSMRKRRRFPKLSFSEYCIALCDYFIDKKEELTQKKIRISDEVYPMLQTLEWPGNVTQIKNFVDWLYILVKSSTKKIDIITANMLPNDLLNKNKDENNKENKSIMNMPIKDARKNFEKQYLINQVRRFGGNISKTANFIGMERSALHRKIKEIGVKK